MKKTTFILFIVSACFISACSKGDYDLERSIYVPDEDHASLPAYSEWGYNTFGAFYERKIFIYNDNEVPAKVIRTNGRTRFVLKGGLAESSYNDYYYYAYRYYTNSMSLSFDLPGFEPEDYTDLVQLNDTIFDLADPLMNVTAIIDQDTLQMDITAGSLQFKKAQHLLVDGEPIKVILSGLFEFQALMKGEPVSMSYGRFDVGIDPYEFANY